MRRVLRLFAVTIVVATLAGTLIGCGSFQQQAAKPSLKFAMILPGPIADEDYNMTGYQAVRELSRTYSMQVAYAEKVAVADAEAVARAYIAEGYGVIAFHGGQFVATGTALAKDFPSSTFVIETSGETPGLPPNVWNVGRKFYMGAYALGVLAAKTSRSGKVGIVAGTMMQDMIERVNAVRVAMDQSGQKVHLTYKFIGDQNDSVKAQEVTQAMIADGVDFVIGFLNGGQPGIEKAIKATNGKVLIAGYYTDKSKRAPGIYTTNMVADFSQPYKHVVAEIMNGKKSGYYEMAPGRGLDLTEIALVPDSAKSATTDTYKQLVSGRLAVAINSQKLYDQQ